MKTARKSNEKKVNIIKHRNIQSGLTFHFIHHDATTEWIPFQRANILCQKEVAKYCNEKFKNPPQEKKDKQLESGSTEKITDCLPITTKTSC